MADIKIYGTLSNDTTDGILARTDQLHDVDLGKFQDEINREVSGKVDTNTANITTINGKVDANTSSITDINQAITNIEQNLGTVSGDVKNFSLYQVVESLPNQDQDPNKIYLVVNTVSGAADTYTEYIWLTSGNTWEKLGEYKADVDLTPYLKKDEYSTSFGTLPANVVTAIEKGTQTPTDAAIKYTKYTKGTGTTYSDGGATEVSLPKASTTMAGIISAADYQKFSDSAAGSYLPLTGGTMTGGIGYSGSLGPSNEFTFFATDGSVQTISALSETEISDVIGS